MAKFYNEKTNEIYWSDADIYCPLEDAWFQLLEFLAVKKLDGHDVYDQWYMAVERKIRELLDVLAESPVDELDGDMKELY